MIFSLFSGIMFHKLNVVGHDMVNNNPIRKNIHPISFEYITKAINAKFVSLDLSWIFARKKKAGTKEFMG